jgi:hypothetical protein
MSIGKSNDLSKWLQQIASVLLLLGTNNHTVDHHYYCSLCTHLQGLFILQCLFVGCQVPQGRCGQASVRLLDACQLIDSLNYCLDVILNSFDALCVLTLALPTQTSEHKL